MFRAKFDRFLLKLHRKYLIFMVLLQQEHYNKYGYYDHKWILRFASLLPSPSQLNAVSVLESNSAEKLAEFLIVHEKR